MSEGGAYLKVGLESCTLEKMAGASVHYFTEYSEANRRWFADRIRLMNITAIQGASLSIQPIQGEPCWIGAWRDGSVVGSIGIETHPKHIIMAVAFGVLQSLHSAHQKNIVHKVVPKWHLAWLDGSYGWMGMVIERFEHTIEQDIYLLGIVLIEMFGTDAVPEEVL